MFSLCFEDWLTIASGIEAFLRIRRIFCSIRELNLSITVQLLSLLNLNHFLTLDSVDVWQWNFQVQELVFTNVCETADYERKLRSKT